MPYSKPRVVKTKSFGKGGAGMYVWHVPTKTLAIGREDHGSLLNALEEKLSKKTKASEIIYGTFGSNFMDVRQHPKLRAEQLSKLCTVLKSLKLKNVPVYKQGPVKLGRLHELAGKRG